MNDAPNSLISSASVFQDQILPQNGKIYGRVKLNVSDDGQTNNILYLI